MWILIIILVLYGLSMEIKSALVAQEMETDIDLVPIEEVPFPAIIVDLGGEVDPVGYIADSKDIANEDIFANEGRKQEETPYLQLPINMSTIVIGFRKRYINKTLSLC